MEHSPLKRLAIETHMLFYSYQFPPIAIAYIWPKDSFWVSTEEKKGTLLILSRVIKGQNFQKSLKNVIFGDFLLFQIPLAP